MSDLIGCDNFVQNAWRKDLCTNCQKHKAQHPRPSVTPTPRKTIVKKSSSSDLLELDNHKDKNKNFTDTNQTGNPKKTDKQENGEKSGGAIPKLKRTESKPVTSPKPELKRLKETKPKSTEQVVKTKVGFRESDPDIIGYDGGAVPSDSVVDSLEGGSSIGDLTESVLSSLSEEEKERTWQTLQNTRRNSSNIATAATDDQVKLRRRNGTEKSSSNSNKRRSREFEDLNVQSFFEPGRTKKVGKPNLTRPFSATGGSGRKSPPPKVSVKPFIRDSPQNNQTKNCIADNQYRVPTSNKEVNPPTGDPYQVPTSNQQIPKQTEEPFYHTYDVGKRSSREILGKNTQTVKPLSAVAPTTKNVIQPYTVVDISKKAPLAEPESSTIPPRLPTTPAPEASRGKSPSPALEVDSSGHRDRRSVSSSIGSESPRSSTDREVSDKTKQLHKMPSGSEDEMELDDSDMTFNLDDIDEILNAASEPCDLSRSVPSRASLGKSVAFEAKMAAVAHNLDRQKKPQQPPFSDKPVRKERDKDKIPQRHHSDVVDSLRPSVMSPGTTKKKASSLPTKPQPTTTAPPGVKTETETQSASKVTEKADKAKKSGGRSFFKKFLKFSSKESGPDSVDSTDQVVDSTGSDVKTDDTVSDLSDSEGETTNEQAQPFSPTVKPRQAKPTQKDLSVKVIPGVMGEIYGEQTSTFNAELKKALCKSNSEPPLNPRDARLGSTEESDEVESLVPSPRPSILSPSKTDKASKFDAFSSENHTDSQKVAQQQENLGHHKMVRIQDQVRTIQIPHDEQPRRKSLNSDLEQKHDQIRTELEKKLPQQKLVAKKPTTVPPSPPTDRQVEGVGEMLDQEGGGSSTGGTDSVGSLEEEYYGSCDEPIYPGGTPRRKTVRRMKDRPPPPPDPVRRKSCTEGADGNQRASRPPSMPITDPPPPPIEALNSHTAARPMSSVEGMISTEISPEKAFKTLPKNHKTKALKVSTDEMLSARKKEKSVAKHARNRTLSEGIKLEVEWDEEFKFRKKSVPVIKHPHLDILTRALPSPPQEIPAFATTGLRSQMQFDNIPENIYDMIDNYNTIGDDKPVDTKRLMVKPPSIMTTSSEYLEPVKHSHGACQTSPGGQKVTGVARQNSVLGVETAHSRLSNGSDLSPLEHSPDGTTEKRPRPRPRRRPQQRPPPPGAAGVFMAQGDTQNSLYANREIELERSKPATNMAEGFRKMATMNLEALQEISDRLMAELVQTGSRPRGDLTWKDFTLVSDEAMCVQGGMVFHAAKEKKNQDKNCVLMISLSPLHPDILHLMHQNVIRVSANFHDTVPTECLPDQKDEDLYSIYGTVQATVAMIRCSAICCLEDYMAGIHHLYEKDPIPYERNVCYILVQLLNGLLYLHTKGFPLPSITTKDVLVVTPCGGDEKTIVLNPFNNQLKITPPRAVKKQNGTEEVEGIIAELLQIIPDPEQDISAQIGGQTSFSRGLQKVAHALRTLDQHPLTIARNIAEFLLWGPQEEEIKTLSLAEDREQAFSVWLELERCKMLNQFAKMPVSHCSVEERNHIKFLCRTTGYTLFDTTKLLHK